MNPRHGAPNESAPKACSAASSRPNRSAAARSGLACGSQASASNAFSAKKTSGIDAAPASPSQRNPAASAARRAAASPAGAWAMDLMKSSRPSARVARKCRAPCPPPIGRSSRTGAPIAAARAARGVPGARPPGPTPPSVTGSVAEQFGQLTDQPVHGGLDQVVSLAERGGALAVRVGHLRTARCLRVERPQQPIRPASPGWPLAIRSRLRRLDRSVASSRSNRPSHSGPICLARCADPSRPCRASSARRPAIHRLAQVPVPGARALHADSLIEPGPRQFDPEQGFGHRRAAHVAQAYHANLVFFGKLPGSRWRDQSKMISGHDTRMAG